MRKQIQRESELPMDARRWLAQDAKSAFIFGRAHVFPIRLKI